MRVNDERCERITVRMLLRHTSGLFDFTGEVNEDGTYALGLTMPYGPHGDDWLERRFESHRPQGLVASALSRPARFEPGARRSYSNTNYVLARLVIERVTGRTAGEEMQRLILGPFGMSHTAIPTGPRSPHRTPTPTPATKRTAGSGRWTSPARTRPGSPPAAPRPLGRA